MMKVLVVETVYRQAQSGYHFLSCPDIWITEAVKAPGWCCRCWVTGNGKENRHRIIESALLQRHSFGPKPWASLLFCVLVVERPCGFSRHYFKFPPFLNSLYTQVSLLYLYPFHPENSWLRNVLPVEKYQNAVSFPVSLSNDSFKLWGWYSVRPSGRSVCSARRPLGGGLGPSGFEEELCPPSTWLYFSLFSMTCDLSLSMLQILLRKRLPLPTEEHSLTSRFALGPHLDVRLHVANTQARQASGVCLGALSQPALQRLLPDRGGPGIGHVGRHANFE